MAKKSSRDEFSAKTKRDLAARAGHFCSFPGCTQPTSGPSAEANAATVNVGEACHISAAAPGRGARRYDTSMTSGERTSIENGIWLCGTHAKLIDSDEETYTVEQLHEWKREAEVRAEQRLRTRPAIFESLADRPDLVLQASVKAAENQRLLSEEAPQPVERAGPSIAASMGAVVSGIHSEIDDAFKYVKRGQPQITVDLLEKIRKREWDRLSARERYRVLANIGNAKLAQQDKAGAARFYLKAVRHQPADENARVLEALAYQLLDYRDRAYDLATAISAEQPEIGRAHMIRIRAAPEGISLDELLEAVPSAARGDIEVALALHDRAVEEGRLADAEQILRDYPDAEQGWAQLTLALGSTILEQEITALQVTSEGPIVADASRISEAADLFRRSIGEIPDGDPEGLAFGAYLNRGTARSLLGDFGSAGEDFRKAYELRPSDKRAVIAVAGSLYSSKDNLAEAIATLELYLKENTSLEVEVLLTEFLRRREGAGDFEKAVGILEGIVPRLADLQQADLRAEAVATLVDLYIRMGNSAQAEGLFEQVTEGIIGATRRSAILGDTLRRIGRAEEALAQAAKAKRALGESDDWSEVGRVAQLMERLGQEADTFELLRRVILPDFVTVETIRLLKSARRAGDDNFVLDFCRRLRAGGHYDLRSFSIEVEVLTNYSEVQKAREAFLDYLKAKPDDKIARLNLTVLALKLGWKDLVDRDPARLPAVEELDAAEIGAVVADVFRAGPDPTQAVNYAYDLYRRFPEEAAAHRALIVSVLAPGPAGLQMRKPTTVAPGVAVRYGEVGTEDRRWLVVEDSRDPSLIRKEYPDSHSLVKPMLGKSIGDEFSLPGIRDLTGTVVELLDKRVYRANELLKAWKERFPDKPTFEAIPVRVTDRPTPEDFAEVMKIMKRFTEDREKIEAVYVAGRIPISTLAEFNGKTVFETVRYLAAKPELPVRACRGMTQDIAEAMDALDDADTVIIGPSAIATLALIEQLDLLNLLPFTFLVTESTIHELRILAHEDRLQACGYMSYKGGRLHFEEVSEEQTAQWRERLRAERASLEQNCEIIGGGDLAGVDASVRKQLSECVTAGSAEAAAAASRRAAVLWTDDHLLHELVKGDLPALRVWTDAVFMWASAKGIIEQKNRSSFVARMLRYGYFFTSSSSGVVLDTCEATSWRPEDPDLTAVLGDFGSTSWSHESARGIVQDTISRVWREAPSEEHARAITARLLSHLADRPDHVEISQSLLDNVDSLLGLAIARAGSLRQVIETFHQGGVLTL